jgi:predicted signal transduction protein with EAL and GGDEF domain
LNIKSKSFCDFIEKITGKPIGFRGIARDITDRKRMEAEILALSITDQLTGLHNRRGFLSLAGQQLKLAERNKTLIPHIKPTKYLLNLS